MIKTLKRFCKFPSLVRDHECKVNMLFNANSAIFQLYHGENKSIFNEMMKSALF